MPYARTWLAPDMNRRHQEQSRPDPSSVAVDSLTAPGGTPSLSSLTEITEVSGGSPVTRLVVLGDALVL